MSHLKVKENKAKRNERKKIQQQMQDKAKELSTRAQETAAEAAGRLKSTSGCDTMQYTVLKTIGLLES